MLLTTLAQHLYFSKIVLIKKKQQLQKVYIYVHTMLPRCKGELFQKKHRRNRNTSLLFVFMIIPLSIDQWCNLYVVAINFHILHKWHMIVDDFIVIATHSLHCWKLLKKPTRNHICTHTLYNQNKNQFSNIVNWKNLKCTLWLK